MLYSIWFNKHRKDSLTFPSLVSTKSLYIYGCRCLVFRHVSTSGIQRWSFGWCFLFHSVCFRVYLDWCEDSSKTWFHILCPDCALSHLLSSQRSKAPCVWLNSSPHYPTSTFIHCQLGLFFVLQFFAFYSQSQTSILLILFQMFRIKRHISNSFWVCCSFLNFFFIYIDSFSHLKIHFL